MATVTGLNSFTAGTPAKASEVNANFSVVKSFVEGLSTGANIDASAVSTSKIADYNVTNIKIANNSITSDKIVDGTIVAGDIATGAITSDKIANLTIVAGDIADSAITSAKIADLTIVAGDIADGAITSAKIFDNAVTSAKIADNTIVLGDLAVALQRFLVPVGTINAYAHSVAPPGWLMCDGTSTAGYALLASYVGSTTPNLSGKFPMGKTGSGTGSTLLGTGGSNTIAEGNLPVHTHANTVTNNAVQTGNDAPDHTHNYTAVGASGTTISSGTGTIVGTTSSGGANQRHIHEVTSNVTISNASVGSGTAYFQPFVAVNYIIKHD